MSLNHNTKCITKNDSNIPVPKCSGGKKWQGRSQFPELQKYIETIIRASNAYNTEDYTNKGEKLSKPGKAGITAIESECKKLKKRQFNLNFNSERVKQRSKTTVSVSSRENISNQFFTDFGHPRNWEIVTTQNDFHINKKIEKALKTLFPNPYKLLETPETNKSKIPMYVEKIKNDDVTLPDVIISEIDDQKSACIKSIFEADYDKSSSQTDFQTSNSSSRVKNQDTNTHDESSSSSFSHELTLNATPSYMRTTASDKSIPSLVVENSSENAGNCSSIRDEKKEAQERFPLVSERKTAKQPVIDCDIGKLKLLTVIDSDDSSKDTTRETDIKSKEDTKNRINSNKISRDDKSQVLFCSTKESRAIKEIFNVSINKHKVNQTEVKSTGKNDRDEQKPITKLKSKWNKSVKNPTRAPNCTKPPEGSCNSDRTPDLKLTSAELKNRESSTSNEKKMKSEDQQPEKIDGEVDEVLKFMCDCLKKFNSKNESGGESSLRKTDSPGKKSDKWPELDKPPVRKSKKSDRNSEASSSSGASGIGCHVPDRKELNPCSTSQLEKNLELNQVEQPAIRIPEVPDRVYPDSVAINNENIVHTVEIQNELGGFTEEQYQSQISAKNTRLVKSILPLSAKMKKTNMDTYKVLKNALEREEKLLNGEFSLNEPTTRNDFLENSVGFSAKECYSSCSLLGPLKRRHSNFVICVNSLPCNIRSRNMRTFSSSPWTISLDELPRAYLTADIGRMTIKPLPYYENLCLEELKFNGSHAVIKQARKGETVLIKHRSVTKYAITPIGVSFVTTFLKVINEIRLKNSESQVISKCRPIKRSFYVKPTTPPKTIAYKIESCQKIEFDLTLNLGNQIEALEEAIEETEKVYFLEQHSGATYTVSDTSTVSKNETFRNTEWNDDSEKRKLHELLARTNDLQQKIQQHLKRLTERPTSLSCPTIQQDGIFDFGTTSKNSEVLFETIDKTTKEAMVYWYLQSPPKSVALDGAISVTVQKTDQATSYDPPLVEEMKNIIDNEDSDDDDESSAYSFKSSNDFSEYEKESRILQAKENTKFPKNIANEIKTAKNRIALEKGKEKDSETKKDEKNDFADENMTVSSESVKTSNKMLTTVFKGKESLTELSLGLKAIPLTKVSNISVEKRKFSDNHTKISIAISKENANEFLQEQRTKKEMMCSRLSYYMNSIRPSLASNHSGYSRTENGIHRIESEDEDDYKSVVSSLTRPRSENNLKNQGRNVKKVGMNMPKSINKYRFDFYKKMDTSNRMNRKSMSNTSCSYKEFEPLKQALTEMQMRMRSIKNDAYFSSNDYYQRALKLAKMSAGYCQSCGSRAVIPQDTFGYYSTILPRNRGNCRKNCHLRATPPNSSYYSLQSSFAGPNDQFCDRDLRESPSCLLNSSRTVIRN